MTDFLAATSLPVNVPLHRYKEASHPNTPMREQFDRCGKIIKFNLACKLFSFQPEEKDGFEEGDNDKAGEALIFKVEL